MTRGWWWGNGSRRRQAELGKLLEEAVSKLREAKADVRQSERTVRMNDAIENMRRLFGSGTPAPSPGHHPCPCLSY